METSVPQLLSLEQAARLLGVSLRTARRLGDSGELRVVRVGPKLLRVSETELNRYIAARDHARPAEVA